MADHPSTSESANVPPERVQAFLRKAEAYLALGGPQRDETLPALAYEFQLSREEFAQALRLLYSGQAADPSPRPQTRVYATQPTDNTPPNPPQKDSSDALVEGVLVDPLPPASDSIPSESIELKPSGEEPPAESSGLPVLDIRPQDLTTFFHQGRLILSEQRGLNSAALTQIHHLADQLLIPHESRSLLIEKLADPKFCLPDAAPNNSEAEEPDREEEESNTGDYAPESESGEKKSRKPMTPARKYRKYLKKALQALPTTRINPRREEK